MKKNQEVSRWLKVSLLFALAGFALWRSIVYVDPNPHYPALASLMCGLWAVSLVLTGLGIATENRSE
ncbi:MAG TPA: hypothetical protein VG722_13920 [Tepidisphaeraceae bacterium]|nr:hypothetical protein [Tepidisphaeraceae bacterium]